MNSGTTQNIDRFLARHKKIGLDTNVLIALVETNLEYTTTARDIIESLDDTVSQAWVSVITVPETLIKPMHSRQEAAVAAYEDVLYHSPFSFAEIKLTTARTATLLGARYNLDTHDSLILASLIEAGVNGFITADKDFISINEVEVLLIG